MIQRPHFIDAQQMNQEYPDTFDVPNDDMIRNLDMGDMVKVSNGRERFWIEIAEKKTRGYFDGVVMNRLIFNKYYTLGSLVRFHTRHIYKILQRRDP